MARDAQAHTVAVPEPLNDRPTTMTAGWQDQLAALDPTDRTALVRAWWQCLGHPGEVVEATLTLTAASGWERHRIGFLNLLHDPTVGVVLIIRRVEPASGPPTDQPPAATPASYESPTWIIQHLDEVGMILRTEGMVGEVFGVAPQDLEGRIVLDVVHPDDHDPAVAMWMEVVAKPGTTRTIRQRILRTDGSTIWIESTVMNQLDDPAVGAVVAVSHDVSERFRAEAELRASEARFRTLAEGVPVAVFHADGDGRIDFHNGPFEHLTAGFGPIERIFDLAADDERASVETMWDQLRSGRLRSFELEITTAIASVVHLRAQAIAAPEHGFTLVGTVEDVTESVRAERELRRRADQDPLTGLANRRVLEQRLARTLHRHGDAVVVIFVDLDGFKVVNDRHGHQAGDRVLAEVGRRMAHAVRPDDFVARYGGDEFVVVCPVVAVGDESRIAERVRAAFADPIEVAGSTWQPQASVGAIRGAAGDDAGAVLARADAAMYVDKSARNGRRG